MIDFGIARARCAGETPRSSAALRRQIQLRFAGTARLAGGDVSAKSDVTVSASSWRRPYGPADRHGGTRASRRSISAARRRTCQASSRRCGRCWRRCCNPARRPAGQHGRSRGMGAEGLEINGSAQPSADRDRAKRSGSGYGRSADRKPKSCWDRLCFPRRSRPLGWDVIGPARCLSHVTRSRR